VRLADTDKEKMQSPALTQLSSKLLVSRLSRARPLVERHGTGNASEYEPTAEQRALVESASAIGITQAEIANQLKIDEKTLRKHFRE
jgi:DNA-binding NarL/FixJ family response regulator